MSYQRLAALCSLTLLASCEDIPTNPTWFGEIQGILRAGCGRCHSEPAANGAPTYFRLDRYVRNDGVSQDAWDLKESIVSRAVNLEDSPMPPDLLLSDRQRDILERWVEQGAPKGSRDNALPGAELLSPVLDAADQELAIRFRSFDDDGDGLVSQLGYRDSTQEVTAFAGAWGGGIVETTMDMGQLASKERFDIVAILDDGFEDRVADNQTFVTLLSDVLIDHGERGTAPTVSLSSPNGGETIFGVTSVRWAAADPDAGEVLSIDLNLLRMDGTGDVVSIVNVATGLPNTPSSFSWDPEGIAGLDENGAAIFYKMRVTATDSGARNARSDDSDATFSVAEVGGETSLTWADVKPLFVTYCAQCHGQPARTQGLEDFRLDKYNAADTEPPANDDLGVLEKRTVVFDKLVARGSMPPNSEPQPSQTEIDTISEWIRAGAPFGADAPPTFTWTSPNDDATTTAQAADITIEWTATDPESLPLTGSISMTQLADEIPPLNAQTATCDAGLPGWSEVVGSENIEDGSFVITLPNTGFFCFKADLSDAGGQSITSVASKPIQL